MTLIKIPSLAKSQPLASTVQSPRTRMPAEQEPTALCLRVEPRVPPADVSSEIWQRQQGGGGVEKIALGKDRLPVDPRHWSRKDVEKWLTDMAAKHQIEDLRTERFLMNGKALCLMTIDMYLHRVPLGGKMLYKDFQLRLARAMYLQDTYVKRMYKF